MILGTLMLGEVAEMVKALFPDAREREVTMENLRVLRRNHIVIERDVGLAHFRGRSLVRFATALAEADRMCNNARRLGVDPPNDRIEEIVMRSFCHEAKVYDRAMEAYNGVVSKRVIPAPSQEEDLRILDAAGLAAWMVWDEDR